MPERYTPERIEYLIGLVTEIRNHALALEASFADTIAQVPEPSRLSARNLLHYLGLRQHDIRELQQALSFLGLSSLGRCESHTMATLENVIHVLHLLAKHPFDHLESSQVPVDMTTGPALLSEHTKALLGDSSPERDTHIMVTMPSEAAQDYHLVHSLLKAGMGVMRINSAHDDAGAWKKMIAHLERAKKASGLPCRVLVDLCGPKLRTGSLGEGTPVLHIQPVRNIKGQVVWPAKVWVTTPELLDVVPDSAGIVLSVEATFLQKAEPGDHLRLRDARQKKRRLYIIEKEKEGFWVECSESTYIERGQSVRLYKKKEKICQSVLGNLPLIAESVRLFKGDTLFLTAETVGQVGVRDTKGKWNVPPCIPCTLPEVFENIQKGERILFDDNAIAGVVRQVKKKKIEVEITRAKPTGSKLGADKGINLPDSSLDLPALSETDLDTLDFAVKHADMVGLSFLRQAEDVKRLIHHLAQRKGEQLGILLKIENRLAFENLGDILLTALTSPPIGVMVARGDLAAEVGFERLAEVQEQILWLCEAAHIPVIWATQVLEQLAKKGVPSRAEVTDAAMSARAECVMLNKGPYVVEAVHFLNDVLKRMQRHQRKKRAMLRKLSVSLIGKKK